MRTSYSTSRLACALCFNRAASYRNRLSLDTAPPRSFVTSRLLFRSCCSSNHPDLATSGCVMISEPGVRSSVGLLYRRSSGHRASSQYDYASHRRDAGGAWLVHANQTWCTVDPFLPGPSGAFWYCTSRPQTRQRQFVQEEQKSRGAS